MVMVVARPESKRATCHQCKCVLEYQYDDMNFSGGRDISGVYDRSASIQCPNCNYRVGVPYQF